MLDRIQEGADQINGRPAAAPSQGVFANPLKGLYRRLFAPCC